METPNTNTGDSMLTAASPIKLRNGTWGARAQSTSVAIGDTITITTLSGKSWDALVDRILWTGDGVSICATSKAATAPSPSPSRSTARTWTGCMCGSIEEYERANDCFTCKHDRF